MTLGAALKKRISLEMDKETKKKTSSSIDGTSFKPLPTQGQGEYSSDSEHGGY